MKKITFLALSLIVTSNLFADQCAYVSKTEAAWAQKIVDKGDVLVKYCEPCGDKKVKLAVASTIENKSVSTGEYSGLFVNGELLDLAYTFVKTGENTYTNLAKMVGCEAQSVSEFISL